MKKIKHKLLLLIVALMYINVLPVYAQVNSSDKEIKINSGRDSALLSPWETKARDIKNNYMRGSIISTGIAEIANEGGGDIQIALMTLAHKSCDMIRHKAYLDRWNETEEIWQTVDNYDFFETKDDHPEGNFSALTTTFVVLKQPTGHYYRVRATHTATYEGSTEMLNTRTDGLLITK